LATPVDALHFALGPLDDRGERPVAVVARADMEAWLAAFPEEGPPIELMTPDFLCLPEPPPETGTLAFAGHRVLARLDRHNGFACEPEMLSVMLDGLGEHRPQRLIAYLPTEGAELPVELNAETERREYRDLTALLRDGLSTSPPIELRQHDYAPAARQSDWWRPLRFTAALAAAWVLLLVGVRGLEAWQLQQRVDAYRETAEMRFREAFPKVDTINNIRVQAEQELRALQGQGSPLFDLLQATAAAMAADESLRLRSIQYRDGWVAISLRGDSMQALEKLRNAFADQPQARLELESADAAETGVQIRARVTLRQA